MMALGKEEHSNKDASVVVSRATNAKEESGGGSDTFTVACAVGMVFLGCCSNVVFLEKLIRNDPGAGNAITFFQFLFIATEGLVFTTRFLQKKPAIPIRKYMVFVVLFFLVSTINNYALNFDIPMPLHMIFRAGSLVANMILGILILGKRYPPSKYIAVLMITIGIAMATIASVQVKEDVSNAPVRRDGTSTFTLAIGITMLLLALFLSARMGIFQEVLYAENGKHPREALFYTHALPLPGFLMLAPDIFKRVVAFSASEPLLIGGVFSIPCMWAYMIGNCLTQYVCIRAVYVLTTECSSLAVTLIITLRKFLSIIFSVFYFQNPFTMYHWSGTALVFLGTLLFCELIQPLLWLVAGKIIKPKQKEV